MFNAAGDFLGYRGLGRDITERARMAAEIEQVNAELQSEIGERELAEETLRAARDELDQRVQERTAELRASNEAFENEITDRKLAEVAIRESELQYRELVELSPDGIIVHVAGEIIFVNDAVARMLGYGSPSELVGMEAINLIAPEFRSDIDERRRQLLQGNFSAQRSVDFLTSGGSRVSVERNAARIIWEGKEAILVSLRDVTDREMAERQLVESRDQLRTVTNNLPVWIARVDTDRCYVFMNKTGAAWLARSPEEIIGQSMGDVFGAELDKFRSFVDQSLAGEYVSFVEEVSYPDGKTRVVRVNYVPQFDTAGEVEGFNSLIEDITELRQAEQTIRDSEERFRGMIENSPSAISLKDLEGRFQLVNSKFEEWYGYSSEQVTGSAPGEYFSPEYAALYKAQDEEVFATDMPNEWRQKLPFADGSDRYMIINKFPVRNGRGRTVGIGTITTDITDHQKTQEQLHQSQKMEAVGQLTGGIAHDFNNLLAVVLGNAEILGDKLGEDSQLAAIERAGKRGAELTERLLSFSRQQVLAPQSVKLETLIPGLLNLISRTLGEQVNIVQEMPAILWPVHADPGQFENALLNLAINARDAMPEGGTLTVHCANMVYREPDERLGEELATGEYVQISVCDTGSGMSDETRAHAFEPFFTTKDVGAGSGLGLSMVYGFARQSGGGVFIQSAPGEGTDVVMYLPRSGSGPTEQEASSVDVLQAGSGELILVLEDDPDMGMFVRNFLEGLSYQVEVASDAAAAQKVLDAHGTEIDLLLSDVVLPGGVSGPQFCAEAKRINPALRVVFMTGYDPDIGTEAGVSEIGDALLTKPFKRAELANTLYEIFLSRN
ncbi:MAG: PAS domain S-box protein [Rhodospirillaceae bacterium]|nr:PAS domain S-box protein [Rhodospirillaceae bacterium]